MSHYRVGEMIRLTRKAAGISQEELCWGICSARTLSRIENGEVRVKPTVYKQLMERMGRSGAKAIVPLAVSDPKVLDDMSMANTALHRGAYEKVAEILRQMRPHLQLEENPTTAQWFGRRSLALLHRKNKLPADAYLEKLEKLLALTIRNYEALLDTVFPFFNEELLILMNIASAHANLKDYEKAIRIDSMLIRSLETGYMDKKILSSSKFY